MKKHNNFPSFPARLDDFKCNSHDQEDDNKLTATANASFLESLDDSTKFDYVRICAAILHHLYDPDYNIVLFLNHDVYFSSDYSHNFMKSFVAHLCLPNKVVNDMLAIAKKYDESTIAGKDDEIPIDVYLDTLKQHRRIQVCFLFCGCNILGNL